MAVTRVHRIPCFEMQFVLHSSFSRGIYAATVTFWGAALRVSTDMYNRVITFTVQKQFRPPKWPCAFLPLVSPPHPAPDHHWSVLCLSSFVFSRKSCKCGRIAYRLYYILPRIVFQTKQFSYSFRRLPIHSHVSFQWLL